MKILFFLFVNLVFTTSVHAFSFCDDGSSCDVKRDKDGLKVGVEVCKDFKGIIRRKIPYKNNVIDGLLECFDEQSKLIESREYKNDKLSGLTKIFKKDLDKYEEFRYLDDERDGESLVYLSLFSSGKSTITGYVKTRYKKGSQDGFTVTYDKDGKELSKICYKNDHLKRENPELCGGAPLVKEVLAEPKDNPDKGWKTRNFKSGKLKVKYLLVDYNDIEEAELYFENEKIKASFKRKTKGDFMKRSSDVYSYKQFDSKGSPYQEGDCLIAGNDIVDLEYGSCSRLSGVQFRYDQKGGLLSKQSYNNGRYDGVSYYYDKSADLETQITYKDNVKIKLVDKKMSTQTVLKTEEYYEDGSTK